MQNITLFKEGNEYFVQVVTDFAPEEYKFMNSTITNYPQSNGEILNIEIELTDQGPELNSLVVHELSVGTFPDPNGVTQWQLEVTYKKDGQSVGGPIIVSQAESEALPRPITSSS